jgi:NAD(P)-dependent dehydrogenase (short-subunit alcohol dehydrogenase family)
MSTFTDRTLVVSGGSRGIGLAIALGAARKGANVVLLAKTAEPHPKLPGSSSRSPEVMGDAAVEILSRPSADVNGKCFVDSAVLAQAGVTDLSRYGGGDNPILDIFVDRP